MHGAVILCAQRIDLVDARLHQQGIGDVVKLVVGLLERAAHAEHLGAHALHLRTVRPLLLSQSGHGKASVRFSVYSMPAAAVLVTAQRNSACIAPRFRAHTETGREIRRAAQQRRPAKADPVHRPRRSLRTPAGSLQAAVRAGTCSSGSPEGRSARSASSAGAAGSVPETPGRRGAQTAFPAYFLEFLAFPALIRYTRLVKV